MRKPFDGTYKETQSFNDACCRASYTKFGLKGHNGIDYACPTGTVILAAISGTVKEVANDITGYGKYIKIENSKEGCLVAHLKTQEVTVDQKVTEGQHIGLSNNTGNSSGPHLHFGYYTLPRDRSNGFSGYIDPAPHFTNSESNMGNITIASELYEKLVKNATAKKDVANYLKSKKYSITSDPDDAPAEEILGVVKGIESAVTTAQGTIARLETDVKNRIDQLANKDELCQKGKDTLEADITRLNKEVKGWEKQVGLMEGQVKDLSNSLRESQKDGGLKDIEIADLKVKLSQAKKEMATTFTLGDVLLLVFKKAFTIKL